MGARDRAGIIRARCAGVWRSCLPRAVSEALQRERRWATLRAAASKYLECSGGVCGPAGTGKSSTVCLPMSDRCFSLALFTTCFTILLGLLKRLHTESMCQDRVILSAKRDDTLHTERHRQRHRPLYREVSCGVRPGRARPDTWSWTCDVLAVARARER